MKNTILTVAVGSAMFLASCDAINSQNSDKQVEKVEVQAEDVPYKEAYNYFVNNTFKGPLESPKITSKEAFDAVFGMATTMGEGGTPTSIDFSKEYVIAVVGEESDIATTLTPVKLTKTGDQLMFSYKEVKGEKQSFSTRPALIVVVDKAHEGDVNLSMVNN